MRPLRRTMRLARWRPLSDFKEFLIFMTLDRRYVGQATIQNHAVALKWRPIARAPFDGHGIDAAVIDVNHTTRLTRVK